MTEYKNIKISQNWDCVYSLENVCCSAKFSFIAHIASKERLYVVLNEAIPYTEIDLIEISNDRYGVIVNGVSSFNPNWGGCK